MKKEFITNRKQVQNIWADSIEQPTRFWQPCDGDCINLDQYELPKDVREALEDDREWQFTALSHYRICNDDNDLVEDRLFLFIDLEPVAVWITRY